MEVLHDYTFKLHVFSVVNTRKLDVHIETSM